MCGYTLKIIISVQLQFCSLQRLEALGHLGKAYGSIVSGLPLWNILLVDEESFQTFQQVWSHCYSFQYALLHHEVLRQAHPALDVPSMLFKGHELGEAAVGRHFCGDFREFPL